VNEGEKRGHIKVAKENRDEKQSESFDRISFSSGFGIRLTKTPCS
jgi:hypothetical protein